MGYENPRDRLELFLKKIIDKSTAPAERRTRFEQFLAGILDGSLVPDDPRTRLELYLKGVAESGGYIPPSGTITITQNGFYNVQQYKNALVNVASGADTEELNVTIDATGYASRIITPPVGKLYSKVTLTRDDTVFKAENIKKDVTLYGVTGNLEGGTLRYDSRQLACTGSHTVNLGWRPDRIIVSYAWHDPDYDPDDPDHDVYLVDFHLDLSQTTDITGEDDYVTFTSTGYTFVSVGTGFNDYPEDYSKLTFTAMAVS